MGKRGNARSKARSRREFLKALGIGGFAGYGLTRGILNLSGTTFPQAPNIPPAFEVVPASSSGITFVHENGRSPEYYLPETLGGGGGFLRRGATVRPGGGTVRIPWRPVGARQGTRGGEWCRGGVEHDFRADSVSQAGSLR